MRCKDEWLREVQEEMRHGRLSKNSHAFLHGLKTTVPGSWVDGDISCGNDSCRKLTTAYLAVSVDAAYAKGQLRKRKMATTFETIKNSECLVCQKERLSKCRVVSKAAQFKEARFLATPAIFANNDVKYDHNKKRAQKFANDTNAAVTYVKAVDTPSLDALREKPGLVADKLTWLQRHDRETGDLYGMLPLVHGMPVALTDHIDRNPEKQLLRGKIGHVHSWVVKAEDTSEFSNGVRILDKLPKAVFVKFANVAWTLPGLTEPGLCPIWPKKAQWFLDKGRKYPVLKISRQQLPLGPAFAITAHGSQGQTLDAAIVDLQIGKGTSPISSYVAITRVRKRSDLLIYRSFDLTLFTRGSPKGPELLLKTLRGEHVDWKAIEEEYTPSKRCIVCGFVCFKQEFAPSQWDRKDKLSCCMSCVERKQDSGTPYECMNWHLWKAEEAFNDVDLSYQRFRRVCKDCDEKRLCRGGCGRHLSKGSFTDKEWMEAGKPDTKKSSRQGKSKDCMRRNVEKPECLKCHEKKPKDELSKDALEHSKRRVRKLCASFVRPKVQECSRCKESKAECEFTKYAWTHPNRRFCKGCAKISTGQWRCIACKDSFVRNMFSKWLARRADKTKADGTQRCNACMDEAERSRQNVAAEALAHIHKNR